ncbi:MAG: ABC transporter ATPase [Bacteroidia bacterium]
MEEHTFHPRSRVWVYTASRMLLSEEVVLLKGKLDRFCHSWTAHDQKLLAGGQIFHNRLLVLFVDETRAGASGCSIDTSARFLREVGKELNCDFFVRNLVALDLDGVWEWVDFKTLPALLESGRIRAETTVIDTSISEFQELGSWEKPLKETWLKRYLKVPVL